MVKITLTGDNKGISYICPETAALRGRFMFFSNGETEKPTIKKTVKNDKEKLSCSAIFEITDGVWKGLRLFSYMSYNFAESPSGKVGIVNRSNQKFTDQDYPKSVNFVETTGVDCSQLAWPSDNNPLPLIHN